MVDACLIPEVPFTLHGEKGLFSYLEKVMRYKGHCVVCVAEGAGQVRDKGVLQGSACMSCVTRATAWCAWQGCRFGLALELGQ